MTRKIQPYESPLLNEVDIAASSTTIFTVLLGMFFLDNNDRNDEHTLISVVLLLILLNVVFSVYWLFKFFAIMAVPIKGFCQKFLNLKASPSKPHDESLNFENLPQVEAHKRARIE